MKTGDAFDAFYPSQFVGDLSKKADLRPFKKRTVKTQAGSGEHVMDVIVAFE